MFAILGHLPYSQEASISPVAACVVVLAGVPKLNPTAACVVVVAGVAKVTPAVLAGWGVPKPKPSPDEGVAIVGAEVLAVGAAKLNPPLDTATGVPNPENPVER